MELKKLEIAMDYPIEWKFDRVLRDLIQNFYDSLGAEEFGKKFRYSYTLESDGYRVVMETEGVGFNYEWLIYVGGSTKTDNPDKYIGKYGEGFKMCALRIMQMGGMTLTMHSQDWSITPVSYTETIDGCEVPMLGYAYTRVEPDGRTKLELTGVSPWYKQELDEAMCNFFYPENVLFGSLVGRGEKWEVYTRSEKSIPCRQDCPDLKGILYINNLARGRLDIPVIINYKWVPKGKSYTRSRPTLPDDETVRKLHAASSLFDANCSLYILELLERKWNEYPLNRYDMHTKYYLVCQLVRNIAADKTVSEQFQSRHKNLCYIERKSGDAIRNRLIEETRVWAKENNARQIVNPIFRLLGADSLVQEYMQIKNTMYETPDTLEQNRAEIVYRAVTEVIPLALTDEMPQIVIDANEAGIFAPLQFAQKCPSKIKGQKSRKYVIHKLAFHRSDFATDAYRKTLLKMADALLHIYGTDSSVTMTSLLTHLGGWLLDGAETIRKYEILWNTMEKPEKCLTLPQ